MYASDQSQSPSEIEGSYNWVMTTDWYEDIFINPAMMNRSIGNTMFITLKGNATYSNVTINTSFGDTSTTGRYNVMKVRLPQQPLSQGKSNPVPAQVLPTYIIITKGRPTKLPSLYTYAVSSMYQE